MSPATILLAEDEEPVRRLLVELLRSAGYCVLAAGSGAEALAMAAEHPQPIALLVTDVAMPAMNGAELARRLQEKQSGTRVLFISGYSQAGALDALAEQPGFQY
ncbi:MAG: response regulator, partial [Terriglobales bacterium]